MAEIKLIARPWTPQDLLDDLQDIINEEPDNYLNTRRTTLEMALSYLKEHFYGWIPVSERLPERGQRVIVRYRADNPCIDNYRVADMFYEIIDGRSIWDAIGKKVTH